MPTPKKDKKPTNVIEQLQNELVDLAARAKVLQNTADAEERSMSAEEQKETDEIFARFSEVEKEIDRRNRTEELENKLAEPLQRRVVDDPEPEGGEGGAAPAARPARSVTGGLRAGTSKGTYGFLSMGEWAVAAFKTRNGKPDQRIVNAPSTFGSEGVNQDGGFAVPPDFRQNIKKEIDAEESLASRCDQQTTSSNSITLPLDNVSPWDTSNGVQVNWISEGTAITASKPKLGALETKLSKLAALVPVTDEMLEDAPQLTQWINSKLPDKFVSELNNVIISGSGIGKPLGILNAGSKVTVAAVAAQGAGTVKMANVLAMHARMYAKLRGNAIWLINQDVEPQLQGMVVDGTSPAYPAYLPPGGLSAKPYGTLLGLPVIPVEECSTLGTEGDIILTDLSQYLLAMKTSGIRADVSMHLYFDSDHLAFRFIMRVGGQSYWPTAIARKNGSNTLSPIITLNSTRT
jgi:HK97 family phage major capsid protein